ncbi:MAG: SO_0444 family Cu/Zn efflux transporter [Candidatus Eisenbacteria bacterium]
MMGAMAGFFRTFFLETVRVLYESGIFVLFGFFIAGLLHHYLATDRIVRHLGKRDFRSILNAAVLGAPLPLCSCGVLPAAVALRRKGASRESVLSFLVSTPETSVESIAVSYGLLGPVFAVVRPLAALFSAAVAGVAHLVFGEERAGEVDEGEAPAAKADDGGCEPASEAKPPATAGKGRFRGSVDYAFVTLFDELVFWFLFGVILTGLLGAVLPEDFFARTLGAGFLSMLFAIAVGIPLYMCASGSTPIAAAFLAKGLNPGAVLVFLLAGPATNAATLTVLGRTFGKRFLQIFLASIVVSALAAGYALNRVYTWSADQVPDYGEGTAGFLISVIKGLGFLAFLFLAWRSLRRTGLGPGIRELRGNLVTVFTPLLRLRPRHLFGTRAGRIALVLAVLAWLASGFYSVRPGEVGLERDFGKVAATNVPPGLHWCFPRPVGRVAKCSVEGIVRVDIGFRSGTKTRDPLAFYGAPEEEETPVSRVFDESVFLTGDENLIDVVSTVHYRVTDGATYVFGVESGEGIVRSTVLWALVRELANRSIDRIYTTDRLDVEERVRDRANRILVEADSGLRIEGVRLVDVHAPREVHYDFRDVASAQEDRARMIHEARVYWQGTVHEARGRGARIVSDASGAKALAVAGAAGSARRFRLLEEAARAERGGTRTRLYLESMERVLPLSGRTVVRPDPVGVKDFELWFKLGEEPTVLPGLLGEEKGDLR